MACKSEIIPERLHRNGRKTYSNEDFLDEHCLYRLGNPIEFPSMLTEYSCNWSFLISIEDVLLSQDPVKNDDFRYSKVEEIRAFRLKTKKDVDDSYLGWHVLSCTLAHSPTECNYSHSVINIIHEIFEDYNETSQLYSFLYTADNWQKAVLKGKSQWFKKLRADYRTKVIALFYYPLAEPTPRDE